MLRQFSLSRTRTHRFDSMLDQCISIERSKCLKVPFEVSLSRLALVTDCKRDILVVVAGWARFEKMGASLVDGANEESDAEWSLVPLRSLVLSILLDGRDETLTRVFGAKGVRIVKACVAHELCQETSIYSHSRDNNAHMGVDFKDFLLVDCQVVWAFF